MFVPGGAENAESKVSKEKLQEVLREFELDDDVNKVDVRCALVFAVAVQYVLCVLYVLSQS